MVELSSTVYYELNSSTEKRTRPLILVADDNSLMRRILSDMLHDSGYDVVVAKNGLEALVNFQRIYPDLVLLDAVMPIMDGYATCSTIRQIEGKGDVPIVMITGLNSEASVENAFASGVDDYITKPVHIPVVKHRLKKLLEKSNYSEKTVYMDAAAAESGIENDLAQTARLQRCFIPEPIDNSNIKVTNIYRPLGAISGDFIDYVWDENSQTLFGYILDATGHGISAAMQAFALRVLFRQAAAMNCSMAEKVAWINRQICLDSNEGPVATAICFAFNLEQQMLRFCTAGIGEFYLLSGSKMTLVEEPGFPLGFDRQADFREVILPIRSGDCFFFLSDGLMELISEVIISSTMTCDDVLKYLELNASVKTRWDDASAVCVKIKDLQRRD